MQELEPDAVPDPGLAALARTARPALFAAGADSGHRKRLLDGRSTGNSRNVWEVLSPYAQRKQSFVVNPVSTADLTDHRQIDPAELAALRIDFSAWLSGLTSFKRRLAVYLAVGHTTNEAARRFRVSAARVSQIRRELQRAWQLFQGVQLG